MIYARGRKGILWLRIRIPQSYRDAYGRDFFDASLKTDTPRSGEA